MDVATWPIAHPEIRHEQVAPYRNLGEFGENFGAEVVLEEELDLPPVSGRRSTRPATTTLKVAEYQRRGLVHFHAVIRVDGPDGPDAAPPAAVTPELLCAVVRSAAAAVTVATPDSAAVGSYTLAWGAQIAVAPIPATATGDPAQLAEQSGTDRAAGYIAKYATKGTGTTTGVDTPIRSEHHIADLVVTEQARAMIAAAWRFGGLADLRLRKWAHMLGFRGHFLTKSRRYSTTFDALRTARGDHHRARELANLGITDTTDIVVVNGWHLTGIGYRSDAERELAAVIAEPPRVGTIITQRNQHDQQAQWTVKPSERDGYPARAPPR